ncbi:MAG: hypothetical protein E6300_16855 [Clostridium sp.]|uniref:hypothetical protein n=1 Tax=Clostridium sp. TaxID=1506 RepID=UPI0029097026|nr:hypothetical protein [Clostridium sp.]MDU7150147.1 hypothetical protein [Clostridium sp.]MDU7243352.1 hypothetical protein [Clostridium sp.]
MDENIAQCKVSVINDSTNESIYVWAKDFNIAELNALKISDKIYINNRYLDVITIVFNYDNKVLEIHVEY